MEKEVIPGLNLRHGWDSELVYKVYIKVMSTLQPVKFDQSWITYMFFYD